MAEDVLTASCAAATKPVPLAGSNGPHPSVSQPYPFSRGTERKLSLKEIVGPKWFPSGQNLNPDISTTPEGLKVSLWVMGGQKGG